MGVAAKILAQAWDPTWKSEVPARGERNRRCADKLRRRRWFFSKCVWQQILFNFSFNSSAEAVSILRFNKYYR